MPKSLHDTVALLQDHEVELHQRGVRHVAVFGSVARGDARPDSDTDILIELAPTHPLGLFAYASLTRYITDLVGAPADVVNRQTVKPLLRETIGREAVDVF
jgi:predicted nucleotidyltransferase